MQANDVETPLDGSSEADAKPDELLAGFAAALNRELDRIGYPPPPARTNHFSADLGISRMQAYRIGRGRNMPSLKTLVKLVGLGVSLDTAMRQLIGEEPGESVAVVVQGLELRAITLPGRTATGFVRTTRGRRAELRLGAQGEALAEGESYVSGLLFERPLQAVAVVEDDEDTLTVLTKELSSAFSVTPFSLGSALLDDPAGIHRFDAFVVDWHLPDVPGEVLVKAIREQTRSPIVLTTGEQGVAHAIGEALHLPNVRYIAKPVDGDILRAVVATSIARDGPRRD